MAPTHTAVREASQANSTEANQAPPSSPRDLKRGILPRVPRIATDDEILGIDPAPRMDARDRELLFDSETRTENGGEGDAADESVAGLTAGDTADSTSEPEDLRAALDANPELRRAWQDAQSYREAFATPEDARAATAVLADMNRMDALFFSRRPEDHAELARVVASLDPAAFASLAQAMAAHAANGRATGAHRHGENPAEKHGNAGAGNYSVSSSASPSPVIPNVPTPFGTEESAVGSDAQKQIPRRPESGLARDDNALLATGPTQAQTEFFHATNAAAVESVLNAIETQVERLLPEGVSKSAKNRVVGEIYRELDTTLRSNRQLGQQVRDAFRSGALDADHQRALVSLVTGRARQALPAVAKRVLSEWTSTIVAANQDRRSRQRAAERRVDIAGSRGGAAESQRSMTPREIDYARMSDADILNL